MRTLLMCSGFQILLIKGRLCKETIRFYSLMRKNQMRLMNRYLLEGFLTWLGQLNFLQAETKLDLYQDDEKRALKPFQKMEIFLNFQNFRNQRTLLMILILILRMKNLMRKSK